MGIKVKQGPAVRRVVVGGVEVVDRDTPLPLPAITPELGQRMLRATMKMVSLNPTPGLLERWAKGQIEAGVACPECGGDWRAWVEREKRRKEEGRLPWENW